MVKVEEGSVQGVTTAGLPFTLDFRSAELKFGAPEESKKKEKKVRAPEGTISSLRPLLREALGVIGSDTSDDNYWTELETTAPFDARTACAKLRSAGIGHIQATELLIMSEPRVQQALAMGNIGKEVVETFVSQVSLTVLHYYNPPR